MKRFKVIVAATFVVLAIAIYAAPVKHAFAATDDSASLGIVPTKNYTITPGTTTKDTLVINNLDDSAPLQLSLKVIDFTYTGDGGTPKLMLAADAPQTSWSLKPYLTLPETVDIPAGASKTVNMSVSIPSNVGAGSYYSAILYSTGAPDGGNVGLSASGVTLVFVSVPGQVTENLTLQKLGAYNLPSQTPTPGYTSVSTTQPEGLAYTLKNAGNVTEAPVGTITMKYMFGKTTTITNVNATSELALIGQTRTFTTCIKLQPETVNLDGAVTQSTKCASPGLLPGRYSLKIDVFYGQNGNVTKEVVGTSSFWYLPVWFIVSFIVLLTIIAVVVYRVYYKLRGVVSGKSNRRIYRKK